MASGRQRSEERLWRRAVLRYVVSLVVVIAPFGLSEVPNLDSHVLMQWIDTSTGETYLMYGTTALLIQTPVPPSTMLGVLFLTVEAYQFNVMGLYVGLLFLAPFVMWSLMRGRWWLLLLWLLVKTSFMFR